LAKLVQFKRMLLSCLEDWGRSPLPPSQIVYATVNKLMQHQNLR